MNVTVTLKEVRTQLSDLIAKVAFGQKNVVITRFGKPVAAIVTYEEYEKMMNPRKRFATQEDWDKGFRLMDKMRENTKKYSPKEVQEIIDEAVKEVRSKKRA
ncbi:MAG TPA: type II toxin-antitoxin system Phd/YefM family antitoxin [Patescibacteria group bacterium]|nr:type II toxin-antitoxin system Phd/YefM family antitoxin [Patescibacteria group bacterium]